MNNETDTAMPNPFGIIARAIYDLANSMTQTVGLSPEQVGLLLAGVIGAMLAIQFVMAVFNKRGWTLYDDPGEFTEQRETPSVEGASAGGGGE